VADDEHGVTRLELFFDLVFVFAFTQVTQLISHHHDAVGVFQGLVILGLLWWTWVAYSWLGNQTRADQGVMPIALGLAAALVFVIAFTIPQAFSEESGPRLVPVVLVAAYVAVRLTNIALYVVAARDDPGLRRQLIVSHSVAVVPMTGLLLAGALVGGHAQVWLWLAALVYDAAAVFFTSRHGDFRVNSATYAGERFGLVVLLALGESTISMGVGLREVEVGGLSIAAVFLAVAGNFLLWWLYFRRFAGTVEDELARRTGTVRAWDAALAYTYAHFAIVAGIILIATGIESALAHLTAESIGLFGAIALGAGGSLVLASTAAIWHRMTRRILIMRLVVAVLFLPAAILGAQLAPIAFIAAFVGVGAVVVAVESATGQLRSAGA
jgi:low temperature requirement protein LtrA